MADHADTHWAQRGREVAPFGAGQEWFDLIMEKSYPDRKEEFHRLKNLENDMGMSTVVAEVTVEQYDEADSSYEETEIERTEPESAQLVTCLRPWLPCKLMTRPCTALR